MPRVVAQQEDFAFWWNAAGWVAVLTFVAIAVTGQWLPIGVLRVLWMLAPALVIPLQVLSTAAYRGTDESVLPWVWELEPATVSLLILVLPAPAAIAGSLISALTPAASAGVVDGAVPAAIASATPIHLGNVAFVVIFMGIRTRLASLRRAEEETRLANEELAHAVAASEQREALARLVHDDVLSALNAAALFTGRPPEVLRREASHALDVLDPRRAGGLYAEQYAPESAVELIRTRLQRIAPDVPVSVVTDGDASVPTAVADGVSQAAAEALRNSVRHAGSAARAIVIEATAEGLTVAVRDDGIGFDQSSVGAERLGLSGSIEGRMQALGGRAVVVSSPGCGTEVTLAWTR